MSRFFVSIAVTVGLLLAFMALPGCERSKNSATPEQRSDETVPPPAAPPDYKFAAGLREQYPEASAFVREFLETCLAGNYTDYRKLVSRKRNPESKERFQTIYYAIKTVTVTSIAPVTVRDLPPPVYRVVSEIEFLPEHNVKLRDRQRNIAILVFQEDGQWRMAPAPGKLQPPEEGAASEPASQETPPPEYPWDQEGDS
jgi:hypothetical protein